MGIIRSGMPRRNAIETTKERIGIDMNQPGQSTISIRRATIQDTDGILECLQSAFAPFRGFYTPDAFSDTVLSPDTLLNRLAEMAVFVAESDSGELVGTISCRVYDDGEGHIRGMAVRPSCQGSGVAAELLVVAVDSELRMKNSVRITLGTTPPLERATAFYKKHGFQPSGKVSDFFGMSLFEYVKTLKA
jgi:N-acetylglutamate synthase-like GNAT family acetyltransferase